ncbi:helix-turn-helix domain-containing protein [Palleronia sp. LCG004]|uniref:helix-turn-helix domain-containing protein n=1 Tax=Palleronia sp. LCG004 TaxID=3079304 RepID=UPI0029433202|nr:helix-turn-helix domain-containing protein [Palleronia sp. LCG004]WOI57864.1 helix-turn-helix domain-containing protein [Palleronia sp. LCG004]
MSGRTPETVQALSRGLTVLTLISRSGAMSLAQLHHATGFSRPSILRLLGTLEQEGFVRRWLDDGLYRINSLSPVSNRSMAWLSRLADTIAPAVERLTQDISWPADVAVLDGDKMAVCETTRRQSPYPVDLITSGYQVHVLQSAVGRTWLAFMEDGARRTLLNRLLSSGDRLDRLALDMDEVERIVQQVRADGYAVRAPGYRAADSKLAPGMRAIGMPVLQDGVIVACLSVSWSAEYLSVGEFAARHLVRLQEAASDATSLLHKATLRLQE